MQRTVPYTFEAFTNVAVGLYFLGDSLLKAELKKAAGPASTLNDITFWIFFICSLVFLTLGLAQLINKRTYNFTIKPKLSYEIIYFGLAAIVTARLIFAILAHKIILISAILWVTCVFILTFLGYKSLPAKKNKENL